MPIPFLFTKEEIKMCKLRIKIKPDYINRVVAITFIDGDLIKSMYIPSAEGCLAPEDIIESIVDDNNIFRELWGHFSADITMSNPNYNGDTQLFQTTLYIFNYLNNHYTKIIPAYFKSDTDILTMDADTMTYVFLKLDDKAKRIVYNGAIYNVSSNRTGDDKRYPDLLIAKFNKEDRSFLFSKTYTQSYKNDLGEYIYVPMSHSGIIDDSLSSDDLNNIIDIVLNTRF